MKELRLSKADTVALWYAVGWMSLCLRVSPLEHAEAVEAERSKLLQAKRALRKVNAIRKAQAAEAST